MPQLSVIMPAYNEAENLEAALDEVAQFVLSAEADAELIVVDDGSTDDTQARLKSYAEQEPRLTVLTQANAGHGPALRAGIEASQGRVLLLLDSGSADFP